MKVESCRTNNLKAEKRHIRVLKGIKSTIIIIQTTDNEVSHWQT